jgi:hypothetical protein
MCANGLQQAHKPGLWQRQTVAVAQEETAHPSEPLCGPENVCLNHGIILYTE